MSQENVETSLPAPPSARLDHDHLSAGVDEPLGLDVELSPNLTDLPAETTQPVVPLVGVRVEHAPGHVDEVEVGMRSGVIWTLQEGKVVRMETDLDPDEALEAAGVSE